ncbi:MAG: START-like domain-containing protein [Flavobacteriales bacterium]|jgi:uncharacterized protein YndB with AHSA1/START domain
MANKTKKKSISPKKAAPGKSPKAKAAKAKAKTTVRSGKSKPSAKAKEVVKKGMVKKKSVAKKQPVKAAATKAVAAKKAVSKKKPAVKKAAVKKAIAKSKVATKAVPKKMPTVKKSAKKAPVKKAAASKPVVHKPQPKTPPAKPTQSKPALVAAPPEPPKKPVPAPMKKALKERYQLEFYLNATPASLFDLISTPSGFSEWFCDDVDVHDTKYVFKWGEDSETATCLSNKYHELMRFRWEEDETEDPNAFFELRIRVDGMTNETCLVVTAHAWPRDLEESKALWESQIHTLARVLGA